MKLYVAFCQDRHTDPEISVFRNPGAAIDHARDFITEIARGQTIYEQEVDGYLYNARYGEEGDYVFVEETDLID